MSRTLELNLIPFRSGEGLMLEAWVKAYYAEDGLVFGDHVRQGIRKLLDDPQLGSAWRIMDGATTIGYCVMTYGFDFEFGGRFGVITDLYVEPEQRGQGIGMWAIRAMKAVAVERQLCALDICHLKHNLRARKLYLVAGFKPVDDRSFLTWRPT